MTHLTLAIERQLYEDRRDLWGITRGLIHAEQYKLRIWEMLSAQDKAILTDLVRKSKEQAAE